jgi:phospholipid/cholesterol/gamma-HCH transport system substrate-binding protein
LQAAIKQSRITLKQAGDAADQLGRFSTSASQLLDSDGRPVMAELRKTLGAANRSLSALETTLNNANPAIETLSTQTLPEVNQLARDMRQLSGSLKSVTERLDQGGVGSLVSSPALPDYESKGGNRK